MFHLFSSFCSDLGIVPPEASLFSLCMCGGAALSALFVALRYDLNRSFAGKSTFLTVDSTDGSGSSETTKDLTKLGEILRHASLSLRSGLCMSFGFLLIGCFRNNESVLIQVCHNVFTAFAFSSAMLDIYFESSAAAIRGDGRLAQFRRIILSLCVFFLVVYSTSGVFSMVVNRAAFDDKQVRLMWSSGEAGYLLHVISAVLEWILIYMLSPYFYTFHSMFVRARYLQATASTSAVWREGKVAITVNLFIVMAFYLFKSANDCHLTKQRQRLLS